MPRAVVVGSSIFVCLDRGSETGESSKQQVRQTGTEEIIIECNTSELSSSWGRKIEDDTNNNAEHGESREPAGQGAKSGRFCRR